MFFIIHSILFSHKSYALKKSSIPLSCFSLSFLLLNLLQDQGRRREHEPNTPHHQSSRLDRITAATDIFGQYYCIGYKCLHQLKTGTRYPIVMSSSTMKGWRGVGDPHWRPLPPRVGYLRGRIYKNHDP